MEAAVSVGSPGKAAGLFRARQHSRACRPCKSRDAKKGALCAAVPRPCGALIQSRRRIPRIQVARLMVVTNRYMY
jgi:hypothetical protein